MEKKRLPLLVFGVTAVDAEISAAIVRAEVRATGDRGAASLWRLADSGGDQLAETIGDGLFRDQIALGTASLGVFDMAAQQLALSSAPIAGSTVKAIVVIPHPFAATSEARLRDGQSETAALAEWLRRVLIAEQATRELPRMVLVREDAVLAPQRIALRIAQFTQRDSGFATLLEEELRALYADYPDIPERECPANLPLIGPAWQAVIDLAQGRSFESNIALDQIRKELEDTFGPVTVRSMLPLPTAREIKPRGSDLAKSSRLKGILKSLERNLRQRMRRNRPK